MKSPPRLRPLPRRAKANSDAAEQRMGGSMRRLMRPPNYLRAYLKVVYWRAVSGAFSCICASLLGFAFVLLQPAYVHAADNNKKQLDDLRSKIEKLSRDLAKSEESRTEVADQLKASESAISEVNRNLSALAKDQSVIAQELAAVEARSKTTRADIAREESLRDKLIRHQYLTGNNDAMRLILQGEDVSQVERQLTYLGYVTKARMASIGRLKTHVDQLAALEVETKDKQQKLAANAAEQEKARATLLAERTSRQKVLNRIRADIDKNKREVGRLKRDENRLTKLVEQIAAELARRQAQAQARARAQAQARASPNAPPRAGERPRNDSPQTRAPGQVIDDVVDAGFAGQAFTNLRGKLKLPVKGELRGRFGAQREEGGVTWKGLFIKADEGVPVRAVADGRVVYADWLRGYGNLVIVDHGSGYLSLYGHNESMVKQVGENVAAGETIASVGSSGGALESGVYFELRQDGKPFDPLRWVGK
jgi:murein hydrolase activator